MNVLITGISSGIGEAIAQACITKGYRVFGTIRKEEDVEKCIRKWPHNFIPIKADVRDESAIAAMLKEVEKHLKDQSLDILINSAGIAKPAPLQHQPIEELQEMFDVNVLAPIRVIQSFLPLMQKKGNKNNDVKKIINISSVAGKISAPFLGGYAASKHALEGFSHSLRRELMPWGIKVVLVAPGNVITPIWGKASNNRNYDKTSYGTTFNRFIDFALKEKDKGMQPEQIAELIIKIIKTDNPKTRYAPVAQKLPNWYIPRLLPDSMIDSLLFKSLRMQRVK